MKHDGIANVLVSDCAVGRAFDSADEQPPESLTQVQALWDTGATHCVITKRVVDECGLVSTGMTRVSHAQGQDVVPTHLISMMLPSGVGFASVVATEGVLTGGVDILIGMDVMNRGDFAVSNLDGETSFSFRMPSKERLDFVARENTRRELQRKPAPTAEKRQRNRRKRRGR